MDTHYQPRNENIKQELLTEEMSFEIRKDVLPEDDIKSDHQEKQFFTIWENEMKHGIHGCYNNIHHVTEQKDVKCLYVTEQIDVDCLYVSDCSRLAHHQEVHTEKMLEDRIIKMSDTTNTCRNINNVTKDSIKQELMEDTESTTGDLNILGNACVGDHKLLYHKSDLSGIDTGKEYYKCCDCGCTFNSKNKLNNHLQSHASGNITEQLNRFDSCGFKGDYNLTGIKRTCVSEKSCGHYKCDGFKQTGHLIDHKRIHTGEKPYKCDVCGKCFKQTCHLVAHKRIHTGEKPYKCDVCGKDFKQAGHLVKHKKIHTGEKPYRCDVCGKGFAENCKLIDHKRTHIGDKPYKCGVCGKSIRQTADLIEHKRIHTGEKSYKCDV